MSAPAGTPLRIHSVDGHPSADGYLPRPRVVVVGVGHAGIEAARALRREAVDVIVVDRNNYHTFQPLLYQVATAGLQPGDITQPARHLFRDQPNVAFRHATVTGVDLDAKLVFLEDGPPLPYDYLVLGAGATAAYYGVEGAAEAGFPLKSAADAIRLRSHVLRCFEEADARPGVIEEGALTFVVVGGGATGVEMSGALRELFDKVLRKDFPALDVDRARAVLVEMAPALMAGYKDELRAYTRRTLEKRGVEVRLSDAVVRATPEAVTLKSGEVIPAWTLIWAAGVRAHPLADALGVEQTSGGRIVVDDALRVPDHPEVFVAGDLAGATDAEGHLYPQVAQVAIQQGRHAARMIRRAMRGLDPETFRYTDLGMMATIGRNAAILQLPTGFTLTGFLAWLGWVVLHVVKLIGFRNRLSVMLNWTYNYFTYDRGPRLIGPILDTPSGRHRPAYAGGEEEVSASA